MLVLLAAAALARPATHTAAATPPEAYYVLSDTTTCPAHVLVGPDGRVEEVTVEGCAAVLHDAVAEAASRWRFAKGPERTLEAIDVMVKPPSFAPRARGKDCLLALAVDDGALGRLTPEPPGHCVLQLVPGAPRVDPPEGRRTTAWCRVRADAEGSHVDACAEGYEAPTRALFDGVSLDARAREWTVLVAYRP